MRKDSLSDTANDPGEGWAFPRSFQPVIYLFIGSPAAAMFESWHCVCSPPPSFQSRLNSLQRRINCLRFDLQIYWSVSSPLLMLHNKRVLGFGCEPNNNRGSASSSANGVALGSSSSSAGRINRSPSKKHSLYITLAPPLTDYDTENSSQSDYDSSHNRETGTGYLVIRCGFMEISLPVR